jgi:septal ring factor EnvC (AmiA/AmiB activator)
VVFAEGGADPIVAGIEATVREIETDISTPKGRGAVASLARRVSSAKVKLDDLGKEYVADLKKQAKTVDDERKLIRDRLDALRDEVRKPLDDFEAKQQARIDEHQAELARIEAAATFDEIDPTAAAIEDRFNRVRSIGDNRDWEEFQKRADAAREKVVETLTAMLETAKRREAERAELEKLRAEQAERAERERMEKVRQEAAAKAKQEAEAEQQRVQREKDLADVRAKLAEQKQKEAEEHAARAAEQAAAAERQRIADEQAAADREREKREANKRHRVKIHTAIKAKLIQIGLSDELTIAVVTAMANGEVPRVTIQY